MTEIFVNDIRYYVDFSHAQKEFSRLQICPDSNQVDCRERIEANRNSQNISFIVGFLVHKYSLVAHSNIRLRIKKNLHKKLISEADSNVI